MDLRTWRRARNRTLAEVADVLGIGGKNPSRTMERYEKGVSKIDVTLAARITTMTGGEVTFEDLCRIRRDYQERQRAERPAEVAA